MTQLGRHSERSEAERNEVEESRGISFNACAPESFDFARDDMKTLPKKIAVLMGGPGSEREVSLATGRGVAKALRSLGVEVIEIDVRDENFQLPAMSISLLLPSTEPLVKMARFREFWNVAASLIPAMA